MRKDWDETHMKNISYATTTKDIAKEMSANIKN